MAGRRRSVAGAAFALVTVAALAACSGGDGSTTAAAESPALSMGPRATVSPAPSATAPSTPAQTPAGPATPATTSGPLDSRSVPKALDLGPGWHPYDDPGQPEEGYLGNGSWVRARGVGEVIAGVVPLGCLELTRPPKLPVPAHALEATYRGKLGAPAVALALDYRTSASARAMLDGMATIARSCPAPADPVRKGDPLTVVVQPKQIDAATVLDRRREYGVGATPWVWSEAVVRQGTRVGLLIVASEPASRPPDLAELAARLRAAVIR